MSVDTKDKVYFAYSPYISFDDSFDWEWSNGRVRTTRISRARATIALQIIGKEIHYGVAICSEEDNFNKKEGRELAEARMRSGFGKFTYKGKAEFSDNHAASLYFLRNMINTVASNIRRVQYKIGQKRLAPRETKLLNDIKKEMETH
jgi:hypothetical protein